MHGADEEIAAIMSEALPYRMTPNSARLYSILRAACPRILTYEYITESMFNLTGTRQSLEGLKSTAKLLRRDLRALRWPFQLETHRTIGYSLSEILHEKPAPHNRPHDLRVVGGTLL